MKKAIAIILCAVMLLPAFSFASFAEATVETWEDLANYGLPYYNASPNGKIPTLDGVVSADEYAQKADMSEMLVKDESSSGGQKPGYFYTYVSSDEDNIYIGVEYEDKNMIPDKEQLRVLMNAQESHFISERSNGKGNDKNSNQSVAFYMGNNNTVSTKQFLAGVYGEFACTGYSGSYADDKITYEFAISKNALMAWNKLSAKPEYVGLGFRLYNYEDASTSYQFSYGYNIETNDIVNMHPELAPGNTSSYDMDDCNVFFKVGSNSVTKEFSTPWILNGVDMRNYGQPIFYANSEKATVDNAIDAVITDGEYAFTQKLVGQKNTYDQVADGDACKKGGMEYVQYSVDYDDDNIYLGLVVHDPEFYARYSDTMVGKEGTVYEYDGEASSAVVMDNYEWKLGFLLDGKSENAIKELNLQTYATAVYDWTAEMTKGTTTTTTLSFFAGTRTDVKNGSANGFSGTESGAWNHNVVTAKSGKYDVDKGLFITEVTLSKAKIAAAYGVSVEEISDAFTIRLFGGKYYENEGRKTAHGFKVWTAQGADAREELYNKLLEANDGDTSKLFVSAQTSSGYGFIIMMDQNDDIVSTSGGASVRFTSESTGMRFATTVDKAAYDAIKNNPEYSNVYFGTVITPADYVEYLNARGAQFTKADLDQLSFGNVNGNYLDLKTTAPYKTGADTYTFVGSIANIVDYTREFAAIGYIAYTEGGVEKIIYSDTYAVRSVEQVASVALYDYKLAEDATNGYTNATDSIIGKTVYSYYSKANRNIIREFMGLAEEA